MFNCWIDVNIWIPMMSNDCVRMPSGYVWLFCEFMWQQIFFWFLAYKSIRKFVFSVLRHSSLFWYFIDQFLWMCLLCHLQCIKVPNKNKQTRTPATKPNHIQLGVFHIHQTSPIPKEGIGEVWWMHFHTNSSPPHLPDTATALSPAQSKTDQSREHLVYIYIQGAH